MLCDVTKYQLIFDWMRREKKKRKEIKWKKSKKYNETEAKKKMIWMQNYFYFYSFLFPSLPLIWPFGLSSFNFSFMQIKTIISYCLCVYSLSTMVFCLLCGRACAFKIFFLQKCRHGKHFLLFPANQLISISGLDRIVSG